MPKMSKIETVEKGAGTVRHPRESGDPMRPNARDSCLRRNDMTLSTVSKIICIIVFLGFIPNQLSALELQGMCNSANCIDRWVSNPDDTGDGTLRAVLSDSCSRGGDDAIQFLIWENIELESPLTIPANCNGRIFIYGKENVRNVLDGSAISGGGCLLSVESNNNVINHLTLVGFRPGAGICITGNDNHLNNSSIGLVPGAEGRYGNDVGIYISGNNNTVEHNHISQNKLDGIIITGSNNIIKSNYIGHQYEECGFSSIRSSLTLSPEEPETATEDTDNIDSQTEADLKGPEDDEEVTFSLREPGRVNSAGGCELVPDRKSSKSFSLNLEVESARLQAEEEWTVHQELELSSGCPLVSNGGNGIHIQDNANNNIIGGLEDGEQNIIQYNGGAGVRLDGSPQSIRNRVSGNVFYKNYGLGIDLGDEGVNPNDKGDDDSGPNNLVNYPEKLNVIMREADNKYWFILSGYAREGSKVEVYLTDGSIVRQALEFQGDESNHGEGEYLILSFTVRTSPFEIELPRSTPRGTKATMLSIDESGNTSEFSENVILDKDSDYDGIIDLYEDRNRNEVVDVNESDPYSIDTDDDGLIDSEEDINKNGRRDNGETAAYLADSDEDGLSDYTETRGDGVYTFENGDTNPLSGDTDCDGVLDGNEDSNSNGIYEARFGETNPRLSVNGATCR